MKHIIRLFFFIFLIAFGLELSRLDLGDGQTVFLICFALTLLVGGGACIYLLKTQKRKLFLFLGLAVIMACSLSASTVWAAKDWMEVSVVGQKEKLEDYKSWVSQFAAKAKNDPALSDYDNIMKGNSLPVINGETAFWASRATIACQSTEYGGQYDTDCENAKKYNDIVGKAYSSMATGCSPIASIVKNIINKNSCWPCDVTALVIQAIQDIAQSAYPIMKTAALNLMAGLFLLWLAYVTLAFFGKFGFARISEYLTNVLNKSILVLIVAAFLHAPVTEIYSFTVSPLVQFTAGLTQIFSDAGRTEAKNAGKTLNILQNIITGGANPRCKYCENFNAQSEATAFLDQGSVNGLLCTVCTVYHQVAPMISLGQGLACFSGISQKSNSDSPSVGGNSSFGVPRIGALLTGAVIVLVFSLLMFMIAYHIIASVLQLGFVIILMPFWMVAYVFKATREYVKNALALLLHALGTLISLSLNVALVIIGFSKLLSGKVALAIGWGIISGSPTTVMNAFTGAEVLQNQESGDGSFFSGLTEKIVDYAVDQAIGMSPTHAIILLVVYAIMSITIVNNTALLVERILDAWLNRQAGPDDILAGVQTVGKGLGGIARLGAAGVGAAAGAVSASYARTRDKVDKNRPASTAKTPATYNNTAAKIINQNVFGIQDKEQEKKNQNQKNQSSNK